jgi:hypothetical protein
MQEVSIKGTQFSFQKIIIWTNKNGLKLASMHLFALKN